MGVLFKNMPFTTRPIDTACANQLPLKGCKTVGPDVLAVSSFHEMVGVLKQVQQLSVQAHSIFSEIASALEDTGEKIHSIGERAIRLEAAFDQKEQSLRDQPRVYFTSEEEKSSRHTMSAARTRVKMQQFFTPETRNDALRSLYDDCIPPPNLGTMDRFVGVDELQRNGNCLSKYSDPKFFFYQWVESEKARLAEYRAEKEELRHQQRLKAKSFRSKEKNVAFGNLEELDWKKRAEGSLLEQQHLVSKAPGASATSRAAQDSERQRGSNLTNQVNSNVQMDGQTSGPSRPPPQHPMVSTREDQIGSQISRPPQLQSLKGVSRPPPLPRGSNVRPPPPLPRGGSARAPRPVPDRSSARGPPPLPSASVEQGAKTPLPPPLPSPTAAGPVSNPGLPSFLQDVQKFQKGSLRKRGEDDIGNSNQEEVQTFLAEAKPANPLMEAIRAHKGKKRASNDEIEKQINEQQVQKRGSMVAATGVAAILAHRIKIIGGDESSSGTDTDDDDWD